MKPHDLIILGLCALFFCISMVEYTIITKRKPQTIEIIHQNNPLPIEIPTSAQLSDTNYLNWLLNEVNGWRTDQWIYYSTNQNEFYISLKTRWMTMKIKPEIKWNFVFAGYNTLGYFNGGYFRRVFENLDFYIGGTAGYNPWVTSAYLGINAGWSF